MYLLPQLGTECCVDVRKYVLPGPLHSPFIRLSNERRQLPRQPTQREKEREMLREDDQNRALPLFCFGGGVCQATACLLCEDSASLRQRRVNKASKAKPLGSSWPLDGADGRTD